MPLQPASGIRGKGRLVADDRSRAAFEERMAGYRKKPGSNGQDEAPPPTIGRGDILAGKEFPTMTWTVVDVMPTGLGILAGKVKIGKSWLAYDIALAVARGELALTNLRTHQCDVLYLALEDPERRVKSRMLKILAGAEAPDNFMYALTWPMGLSCIEELDSFLDQHPGCRLVIVDPLGKVRGEPDGRRGAYAQDYSDMAAFHALANRRNITLLLVHHTRKQPAGDAMDMISGTTAIQGAADFLMVLTRDRGGTLGQLSITGRDIENGGDFAVDFDKATCKWRIIGEAQEVRRETNQDRIYGFLRDQKEPARLRDIMDALSLPRGTVTTTLWRLMKRGSVIHPGKDAWCVRGPDDP
jgi:hypothetical protein